ncbi:diguanylate cyclase [Paraglaciecola sp. T6c]|uniref:sensor domain-containing diguanylate cyclase n=1 Tax=Pseudoalteromonas atlantica (strain T6c / ATCC BAA-1087) TaxID=3042615 RepID=UPI00005C6B66|nr:GGDEF domain-containing protein [Paraglaciecola sp. T6c]ABG39010.1 diguanylate cyclase [Paraglaciecola sp. T6c]
MTTNRSSHYPPGYPRGAAISSTVYLLLGVLLAVFVFLTLDRVIQAQAKITHEVNISGQQRMLLQRASLFASAYLYSEDIAAKQTSLQALGEMQVNHQHLTEPHFSALEKGQASPLSAELQALYFTADNNVTEQLTIFGDQLYFALNLEKIQNGAKLDAKALMEMAYTPLLQKLEDVTRQYEIQDNKRIDALRSVQRVVFWMTIAILLLGLCLMMFNFNKHAHIELAAKSLGGDSGQETPVFNLNALELSARKLIATARRHNESMSVLAFDIDRFPQILTNYGRDTADEVLNQVAKSISTVCRDSDYLGQIEDEKFVLLLPKTSAKQAMCLANKISSYFEQLKSNAQLREVIPSVSIGISELDVDDSVLQPIITRAFHALTLHSSLKHGRVCVG